MKRGAIFQYTTKTGEIVKGLAYYEDQDPIFSLYDKVFLQLINDDFTPKVTTDGKEIIAIVSHCDLTLIGLLE